MGSCWPRPKKTKKDEHSNFVLDVEKILHDHVWHRFKTSRSFWQRVCLRRKNYVVEVPMNYFHFDKIDQKIELHKNDPTTLPTPSATATTQRAHVSRDVTHLNPSLTSSTYVTALSTDFVNSTDNEQVYSFHFEKTRKASVTVTFQKGFSIGGKVNFSLALPKIPTEGKVGGELDMRVNVSKTTGETIEETLTWKTTSEIKVSKNSSYTARVLLSEIPVSYNFKVWTKMYMPHFGAPATVTRKKGGGSSRYTAVIDSLRMVFKGYEDVVNIVPETVDNCTITSVIFTTKGIVDGVRLSDQKILLEGRPLRARPPSQEHQQHSLLQGPHHHHHHPHATSFHNNGGSGGGGALTSDGSGSFHEGCSGPSITALTPAVRVAGRMLALASSSQPPLPPHHPHPSIKEVPEEEGGVVEVVSVAGGSSQHHHHHHPPSSSSSTPSPFPVPAPTSAPPSTPRGGQPPGGHPQVPHITTTSPSSLASSPLSDAGSPDVSESSSKKSQTVTTV
ncbi:uncharacterized protein LOC143275347 [Babylonia areolata]|uniref:uncharacterized protein LOC143275347 n=1 Tax=Babylonia areolata TaxID=304850 RepID=UPI003FD3BB06